MKRILFSESVLFYQPDTRATSSDLFSLSKQSLDNAAIPVIVSERYVKKAKKFKKVMVIQTNVKCWSFKKSQSFKQFQSLVTKPSQKRISKSILVPSPSFDQKLMSIMQQNDK